MTLPLSLSWKSVTSWIVSPFSVWSKISPCWFKNNPRATTDESDMIPCYCQAHPAHCHHFHPILLCPAESFSIISVICSWNKQCVSYFHGFSPKPQRSRLVRNKQESKVRFENSLKVGLKICSFILAYWLKVGVQLRAVIRPVFNTLFLL